MVLALSYVIALILTVVIAIFLYPISGFFWVLGLLGKISDKLFAFTNKAIKSLWADLKSNNSDNKKSKEEWVCSCGCTNTDDICSRCGKPKVVADIPETNEISE